MGQIYSMRTAEPVGESVDYDVIRALKRSVGSARYVEIAEEATFALADRLGRLERAFRNGDMAMCYRHAVNICGIASQIGLVGVANVAADVKVCARDSDPALAAVLARLNRLAEASLFSVFREGP